MQSVYLSLRAGGTKLQDYVFREEVKLFENNERKFIIKVTGNRYPMQNGIEQRYRINNIFFDRSYKIFNRFRSHLLGEIVVVVVSC